MQWLLPELHEWFDCVQFYYLQFNTIRHAAFAVLPLSSLSCFFNLHSCRTYATHGVGKERGLDHYVIDSTQLKVQKGRSQKKGGSQKKGDPRKKRGIPE